MTEDRSTDCSGEGVFRQQVGQRLRTQRVWLALTQTDAHSCGVKWHWTACPRNCFMPPDFGVSTRRWLSTAMASGSGTTVARARTRSLGLEVRRTATNGVVCKRPANDRVLLTCSISARPERSRAIMYGTSGPSCGSLLLTTVPTLMSKRSPTLDPV